MRRRWTLLAWDPARPRQRAAALKWAWQARPPERTESKIALEIGNALVSLLGDQRSGSFGAAAVHQQIRRGDNENRENDGSEQAADDHARQRRVGFAARFQFESHRQKSDNGGQRRHQNRP